MAMSKNSEDNDGCAVILMLFILLVGMGFFFAPLAMIATDYWVQAICERPNVRDFMRVTVACEPERKLLEWGKRP